MVERADAERGGGRTHRNLPANHNAREHIGARFSDAMSSMLQQLQCTGESPMVEFGVGLRSSVSSVEVVPVMGCS